MQIFDFKQNLVGLLLNFLGASLKVQGSTMEELTQLANEVAERSGLSVYDLEFVGSGHHRTLRVFIDRDAAGVSIDDCADFSRGLSLLLDANDLIPGGAYELEVSSPGLERRLRLPWHFEKAVGKKVQIKTHEPVFTDMETKAGDTKTLKAKTLVGELSEFNGQWLQILKENQSWNVEIENIDKAKIVFEEVQKNKKKSNKGK